MMLLRKVPDPSMQPLVQVMLLLLRQRRRQQLLLLLLLLVVMVLVLSQGPSLQESAQRRRACTEGLQAVPAAAVAGEAALPQADAVASLKLVTVQLVVPLRWAALAAQVAVGAA
jgi:hypothetical protein